MSQPIRRRLALLDCDGTLADGQHAIHAAMAEVWESEGLPPPDPARVRRVVGLPLEHAIQRLRPDLPAGRVPDLAQCYRESFRRRRDARGVTDPLFPGALAALDALEAAGWLLGIATGKGRRGLTELLAKHGMAERFVTLQTSDLGPGKPHPEMALRAMGEADVQPACTLMVGDTVFDVQMAKAAGMRALGVAWGYHEADELAQAGAVAVAQRWDEVPALAERIVPPGAC